MKKIPNFLIIFFLLITDVFAANEMQLFNKTNLADWQQVGSGHFLIKDQLLQTNGGMGLLFYKLKKFTNVKLKVIYKTSTSTSNSGVFVRIGQPPEDAWEAVNHGYEIQICDQGVDAFDDYHRTGAIYSFAKAHGHAEKGPNQWNVLEIFLKEEFIKVVLNGKLVSDFAPNQANTPPQLKDNDPQRGPRAISGYIGLQNHDHTARSANDHVYFKEVSVTPLD